jgi:putative two-component system response regulator
VKIATNGNKALQIAFSNEPPDLILLDIIMPAMDGYEVCRRLKSDSQTAGIPVIFLTAKSDIADELKGFELGAVDYIAKPISPPIVLARVRTHLRLKKVTDYLKSKLEREDLW